MKTINEALLGYDFGAVTKREKGPDIITVKGDFVMARYEKHYHLSTRFYALENNLEYIECDEYESK